VLEIDQQARTIRIVPTAHPGRGWQCWWYVRIDGIDPGQSLTLDVGDAPWATPDRAAYSTDNRRWVQTSPGKRNGKRITFQQQIDSSTAYFAWGPPFVPDDARQLCTWAAARCPQATAFTLCRTRADRPVPALRFEPAAARETPLAGVWVQARQHAWESGSSWVCRGFVEWLVSDDPRARNLRTKTRIFVVPIMDIDNVAIGAGGKQQKPHDHNRDWSEQPHWPSVAAAQREILAMDTRGQFELFIDLHNPGAGERSPFFYLAPRDLLSNQGRENLDRFLTATETEMTGPLAFRGRTRESGPGYDKRLWKQISKNWVTLNCRYHVVAVTLETPWNTPHSTQDGYRKVGRQLGLAVDRFFHASP
jgi:murein tripeptide amidase MpaA